MHPDTREEWLAERAREQRQIDSLIAHADYMIEMAGADIPGPDELADYDADLTQSY